MNSRQEREAIFDHQASSFALIAPQFGGLLPCPLCLDLHTREDATQGKGLTLEHVPPRKLGGRAIALTCSRCNSGSGRDLDADWASFDKVMKFAHGHPSQVRATQEVGGVQQRVNVHSTGDDAFLIEGVPKAGHRDTPAKITEALTSLVAAGAPVHISLQLEHTYLPRAVTLSVLRAAYLFAMTQLGWRYALTPMFDPLRAQLLDPDREIILKPPTVTEPSTPMRRATLTVIETPVELRGVVMVSFGQKVAFLPGPFDDIGYWSRITEPLDGLFDGDTVELEGPTLADDSPGMVFDHSPGLAFVLPGAPKA